MSMMDSGDFSAVFQDAESPLFTQREAAELSGVDQKAISNWLDRQFLVLQPVNGRPQMGRRLFSRRQVLTLKFVSMLLQASVTLSEAFALADSAYIETKTALESDDIAPNIRDHVTVWIIFARSYYNTATEKTEHNTWTYDVVASIRHGMMFYNLDGTTFNARGVLQGGPSICFPVQNIAGMLNGEIHLLLAADLDPSLP